MELAVRCGQITNKGDGLQAWVCIQASALANRLLVADTDVRIFLQHFFLDGINKCVEFFSIWFIQIYGRAAFWVRAAKG